MTEVIYDPLEDTVVVTIGTERILMLDNQGQVECNENKTVKDGDTLPSTRDQTFDQRSLYLRLWSVLVRPDRLLDRMTVITTTTTMTIPKSGAEKH